MGRPCMRLGHLAGRGFTLGVGRSAASSATSDRWMSRVSLSKGGTGGAFSVMVEKLLFFLDCLVRSRHGLKTLCTVPIPLRSSMDCNGVGRQM